MSSFRARPRSASSCEFALSSVRPESYLARLSSDDEMESYMAKITKKTSTTTHGAERSRTKDDGSDGGRANPNTFAVDQVYAKMQEAAAGGD